jgi:hypothetical protein
MFYTHRFKRNERAQSTSGLLLYTQGSLRARRRSKVEIVK